MIVKYANTFNAVTTGELVFDDVYVDHATRRSWNVQDWGGKPHLATEMSRDHAAKWIAYRHNEKIEKGPGSHFWRYTDQYTPLTVPHMPVGEYAAADKIVLHGDGMTSSGYYKSGETTDGASWTEMWLSLDNYEDFHRHTECDEHAPQDNEEDADYENCPDCKAYLDCMNGACDCDSKLEQCEVCDRDLGSGEIVWLCMDGGGFACAEHIVIDERPDELFKKVGAIRGEALPAFAWPGGHVLVYITNGGEPICAECANQIDVYDPAGDADADEEMICANCPHAQLEHGSVAVGLVAHPSGDAVVTEHLDVGPCGGENVREDWIGREVHYSCPCDRYYPPLCESCSKPLDPALRSWWDSVNKKEATA